MPPQRAEFIGRTVIADFFATVPADGRLDLIDLVVVRANGQPALAAYLPDERATAAGTGSWSGYRRRRDHYHHCFRPALFAAFGLL
jgi:RNA polymerase sigma-70 factor (ECF subfamily)